jgi:hypothetical protein
MSSKKNIRREPSAPKHAQELFISEKVVDYQEQINKLQLEVVVLKETINLLKKTPALTWQLLIIVKKKWLSSP